MCAKYGSTAEFNLIEKYYRIQLPELMVKPAQIIYPHRTAAVVVHENKKNQLRMMNYSLIPSWSKVRRPKFATYNARLEEVLKKPSWREPFKKNHCLVPLSFFIESVYEGPYAGHNIAISDKHKEFLTAAGIWDQWVDHETGEIVESFAILTTEPPQEILNAGHDRCPVFLQDSAWQSWLEEKYEGSSWVQFLQKNKAQIDFKFEERETLKSFKKPLQ